ncbi:hypothetical protein DL89DRAFT_293630 [Linderina pennispora]|uniref:SNF2 family DNA-dependent ATPase domain-containing protein n=1 Tax=Linderina pennispora TaxID=61395 RepID=A0A1Y1W6Z8_9FUNG|nr:uncharacterized protein DL89DRAFT_293630 [Linderina pennispora]ORX69202.1 hypothetical protein DL89DRAFT_293630 [Linderina pennispora]
MSTRLDRLITLLDTGATPLVRSTAARQIGGIQKQHPSELFRLLARVYEFIGNKSWDTRIAAAQAFDAIAKEVSDWDPSGNGDVKPPLLDDDFLAFSQFNVDSVIRHGRLLLASAGKEYDEDEAMEGLDAQARIAVQRAQIKKRLGLGAQFMDVDLLDDLDLETAQARKRKPTTPVKHEPVAEEPEIDMSKLSARERNRIKRKQRLDGKKKGKVDLGPKKANGATADTKPMVSSTGVDITEQPGGEAIVVEAKKADNREALFAISEGSWPFESLVEILCIDLFDAKWEVRHGAGMALREIFKHHGHSAGMLAGVSTVENARRNQQFLEDVCVRLMCVFTLDRFGDFVSDHVVAPVRETCAQTLGVLSQYLTQPVLLVQRGAGDQASSVAPIWEARHSGLSGLRYIVAVRRDMASLLVTGTLDAALAGLRDHDDDVRSVSAETLLPLVDTLVTCQPTRILDVIDGVWMALTDLGDDLTASVANVMDLLARLFEHPRVRGTVIEAGRVRPEQYAFRVLIPRLYPFFRHTIASVRKATVQALLTFASMQEGGEQELQHSYAHSGDISGFAIPPWVDVAVMRLVMQNVVLETTQEIQDLSMKLWLALLRQTRERVLLSLRVSGSTDPEKEAAEIAAQNLPRDVIRSMFLLMATPISTPMPRGLIYDPRRTADDAECSGSRYNVDAPMIQQDMGLISRETIMRCRVQGAAALGLLMAIWPNQSRAEVFGNIPAACIAFAVVAAAVNPMARRVEFSSPEFVDQMLAAIQAVLSGDYAKHNPRPLAYVDLERALVHVRGDCQVLLASVAELPEISLTDVSATLFDQLCAQVSPRTLNARNKSTLMERQQRLKASIEYYTQQQVEFDVSTNAALAGAVIAVGRLPSKLNSVLRSVMSAIKQERSDLLQRRAASAAARMAALCYCSETPRVAPADKMIKNLATFACSDPWTTPVFAQRSQQLDAILMLEMVQREQAVKELERAQQQKSGTAAKPKKDDGSNGSDASMAAAAAAKEAAVIPLFQASTLTEEQERDQAARLIVRGAESALDAVAKLFGAQLMASVPRLWECVSIPLTNVYGGMAGGGPLTVRSAEVLIEADAKLETAGQEVGSIDLCLHDHLVQALPWAMSALMSKFAAVRHMAARTLAELCRVCTVAAMQPFIQSVLPSLGDTTMTHRRQGLLGETVLPYVTFLMVPVLGRMSDVDEQTRLVCTNCFAQLLKLELIEKREHERKFLAQLMDSSKLEPFKIPVRINATLRKYQQEGVDWLAFLDKYELHGVLCDDMGLGKTLQTICIMASDHFLRSQRFAGSGGQAADCRPLPSLVICPPTLIGHWEQEIKHYTESLRPMCYGGVPAERRSLVPQIAANKADVVVMSYDVVRNDIEYLQGQNWNYCVLDEGHVIKNAKTKLTQAVKRLKARRRLILSGTPVQNNVIELWSLFDFLMPGFLGTERQFNELRRRKAHINGELALKALHKQVLPFLLRRMKEDVLQDLPPKIIQDYHCELSPLQKFLYEEFAKSNATGNLKKSLGLKGEEGESTEASSEDTKKSGTHVFQALQYLRKLCNHPALVLTPKHPLYTQVVADLKARNADLHSLDIAPKMQALQDLLHQCGIGPGSVEDMDNVSANHRVLIFCQHKEMIERIEQDLFQRAMPGVTYMRVDGTVEARRRQEIVSAFNSDPSIDALLLTTHVGGLGLNLTGADTVIFVEHDYNPAMDLQAMDRAHRLGQTRVVNVYRLITRHTLEEKIMGLQAFKLHMANTILLDLFNVSPSDAKESKIEDKQDARRLKQELWDSSQYEDEYNLDNFISSLQQ